MSYIRVELFGVYCADPEDVIVPDSFYIVGGLAGCGITKAILTHPVRLSRGQTHQYSREESVLFEGEFDPGEVIKGGLKAYDEDAGKDWSRYQDHVKELGDIIAKTMQVAPLVYGGVKTAGKILESSTTFLSQLGRLDADDLLGTYEMEIPVGGPPIDILEWKMSHKGSFLALSDWEYTVYFTIYRLPYRL